VQKQAGVGSPSGSLPGWERPRGQVGPPGPHPAEPRAQPPPGPRGRTVANTAAPGSSDRAAGLLHTIQRRATYMPHSSSYTAYSTRSTPSTQSTHTAHSTQHTAHSTQHTAHSTLAPAHPGAQVQVATPHTHTNTNTCQHQTATTHYASTRRRLLLLHAVRSRQQTADSRQQTAGTKD
jgi:hypothetical protein